MTGDAGSIAAAGVKENTAAFFNVAGPNRGCVFVEAAEEFVRLTL